MVIAWITVEGNLQYTLEDNTALAAAWLKERLTRELPSVLTSEKPKHRAILNRIKKAAPDTLVDMANTILCDENIIGMTLTCGMDTIVGPEVVEVLIAGQETCHQALIALTTASQAFSVEPRPCDVWAIKVAPTALPYIASFKASPEAIAALEAQHGSEE